MINPNPHPDEEMYYLQLEYFSENSHEKKLWKEVCHKHITLFNYFHTEIKAIQELANFHQW